MPYRDVAPICPACERGLERVEVHRETIVGNLSGGLGLPPRVLRYASWERWTCDQCGSTLLSAAHLETLLDEASRVVRALDARIAPGEGATSRCPRCTTQLVAGTLYEVAIGRCARHGVWLAAGALEQILDRAKRSE